MVLGVYLALGVVYSLVTPPLEASDEFKHYPYTQYVQTRRALPVLDPEVCKWPGPDDCPWLQDGGQPPAYYALMGLLTSWIDTSDLHQVRRMNRHAFVGNPSQICNKNLIIHDPERERFPWHGAVLAIHLIRFLTLGFGAGTVLLTYLLARDLFPDQPDLHLGAAAVTAFTPMFLFVHGAVNNDGMTSFVGCLFLLLTVRLVRDGLAGPLPWWRYGLMGAVVGLFLLTKLSGLAALILLSLLLTWLAWRKKSLRPLLLGLSTVVVIAALIAGWWFLRNLRLYGSPTALNVFITIQGVRPDTPTLRDWWEEFGTFRWTYWGLFGAVNVMAPRWFYTLFDLLTLVSLAGLVRARPVRRPLQAIPLLWLAILFVSVLRWTWIYFSFQGRLVFPGIAGASTFFLLGLRAWVPARHRPKLTAGVAILFFTVAALLPFLSIRPAYIPPRPLDEVPESARIEPVDMGGAARMVGWELEPQTVRPGESVQVVVYWEAVDDGREVISFARLLGREHQLVGDVNRYPACGMVPMARWQAGQVWRDPYRIPVAEGAAAPNRLRVEVGLYDPERDETLGVVRVGEVKLAPPQGRPEPAHRLEVELADGVSLLGYDLEPEVSEPGGEVRLTLYWKARGTPSTDYQVLVHLLGEGAEPVAQADAPPLGGEYPTGMWTAGEVIPDPHTLLLPADLPSGEYRLLVGMYDLETMGRLARLDGGGDTIELPTPLCLPPCIR